MVSATTPTKSPVERRNSVRSVLFATVLTVTFFSIGLVGIAHHEMWRDELRAWLIARESSTIYQLFDALRYEGTPPLWHLSLFALSRFTADPLVMQIFHLFLASTCIFLVARSSPFAMWQKVLIAIGYFPFFEYAQVSRGYVLSNLFLFAICALCTKGRRNYPLLLLLLSLLASTTVYGAIFAFSVGAALLLERVQLHGKNIRLQSRRIVAAGLATLALSVALFCVVIKPPSDGFSGDWGAYDKRLFVGANQVPWRIAKSTTSILTSYLPVPEPAFKNQFWGSTIFPDKEPARYAWAVISVLIFMMVASRLKGTLSRTSYILGTLGFVAFTFLFYVGSVRQNGMLFILLLASIWMALDHQQRKTSHDQGGLQQLSKLELVSAILFSLVLTVHALVGVFAFYTDLREIFSPTKEIVNYLRSKKLDKHRIVVTPDYCGTGLSAYLNRRVYSLSNLHEISYEHMGSDSQNVWGTSVPGRVSGLVQWWDQPFVLLSREQLYIKLPKGRAKLLKRFGNTIVVGEGNYLYLVRPERSSVTNPQPKASNVNFGWIVWPTKKVQRLFNQGLFNQNSSQGIFRQKRWTPRESLYARGFQFHLRSVKY